MAVIYQTLLETNADLNTAGENLSPCADDL